MANVRHAGKLLEGAQAWNLWRAQNPGVAPNLSDLKLPAGGRRFGPDEGGPIDLSRANLRRAVLAGAGAGWAACSFDCCEQAASAMDVAMTSVRRRSIEVPHGNETNGR